MKVQFKYGIKTYSGTADDMTYGSYRDGNVCIGRKYVSPRITTQNTSMGAKLKNLADIYGDVNVGYKTDLKAYAGKYEAHVPKHKLAPTAFAIFVKMMFLFTKLDEGHIDLATLTYADLQTVGTDIASIADAVDNGYLPSVTGADLLVASM
ncbi:MAG: hypothetical protein PHY48_12495 [Candidatus Cloacimonetes bacterium]|nr:hypothetical protein [Candidatus Cloacimonadota bacterium]